MHAPMFPCIEHVMKSTKYKIETACDEMNDAPHSFIFFLLDRMQTAELPLM